MSTVFISYSQKDKKVAAKVKATLEANGIKVTIDSESMAAGEEHPRVHRPGDSRHPGDALDRLQEQPLLRLGGIWRASSLSRRRSFWKGRSLLPATWTKGSLKMSFLGQTLDSLQKQIDELDEEILKLMKGIRSGPSSDEKNPQDQP
jgi:hypothetical protein